MLSVAVCGWLLESEGHVASDDAFGAAKRVTVRSYLNQIVPETLRLRAAAIARADVLYALQQKRCRLKAGLYG